MLELSENLIQIEDQEIKTDSNKVKLKTQLLKRNLILNQEENKI